ncbi:hypothetical protein ABII15_14875 [Streptomyces sp. HUAS MG91]|uniref:ApeA N-terminal domain-containing protein n=1 Tax=Streptomyces tabacisoli TaxID=3156398 RepID=A0AAU8IS18_9ACTN
MRTAFPYPVLSSDVNLRVEKVFVENKPVPISRVNDRDQIVALDDLDTGTKGWAEVRLNVSASVDARELRGGPWIGISCMAVLTNRKTKVHQAFELREREPGSWVGEIEIHRLEHVERSQINAQIVAEYDGVPGRLIGFTALPWQVDFESRRPVEERSLKMKWLDFDDPSNDHLKEFKESPWLLDFEGGEPVLCLNSSLDGFRGVLENAATQEQKLVREVLSSQIASETWISLFNSAAYNCEVVEGEPVWPSGWQADVLRKMLPDVFPAMGADEALSMLVEARINGEDGTNIQRLVAHAAGIQSRKSRKITTTLRDLRRMANQKGDK